MSQKDNALIDGSPHPIEHWVYPNAAARTADTGFYSQDIGKVALQTDNDSYWRLDALTGGVPTWVPLTTGGLPTGGTAGQELIKNSATNYDASWQTPLVTGNVLFLLASSGTYTPTAGARALFVECLAGGAGGWNTYTSTAGNASMGYGGGGGAYSAHMVTGSLKVSYSYVVGLGGAGNSNGGDTSFDSPAICLAKGGSAGGNAIANGNTYATGAGGAGGVAANGIGNVGRWNGGAGRTAFRIPGPMGWGGGGGDSLVMAGGAEPTYAAGTGNNAVPFSGGGGAGGFAYTGQATQAGGSGAQGWIRVWEFF